VDGKRELENVALGQVLWRRRRSYIVEMTGSPRKESAGIERIPVFGQEVVVVLMYVSVWEPMLPHRISEEIPIASCARFEFLSGRSPVSGPV
jgi:hypothetical protein